jgi:hypothetical protein
MIRTIAAALAAFALVSFGVRADEPAKADAPAADKKMDKAEKKAHKKAKKSKKAAAEAKPADAAPAK